MTAVSVRVNHDNTRCAFQISHPKGNIITADVIEALRTGLDALSTNPHLKFVTLQGDGPDFSFGASIPEHGAEQIGRVLPAMNALVEDLLEVPAPTAAIVRGRCLGGGFELALACDLIFAEDTAVFGLPEVALGVFPPAGAVLLPLRVGARAARAILTGEPASARYWRDAGLIELLAPAAELEREVDGWFQRHLVPKSAVALRFAATAARAATLAAIRATVPELQRLYLNDLMRSRDAAEGIEAFMQKRPPVWQDR